MFSFFKKHKILTHDGVFHADDVFSVATLNILYKGQIEISRSRNPEIIEKFLQNGDIILDNGRDYNASKNIFDHHQEGGAGSRDGGVPYAAFGLIWKHFGEKVCAQEIAKFEWGNSAGFKNSDAKNNDAIQYVVQKIDEGLVSKIDATDTGYSDYYSEKMGNSAYVPNSIVGSFVPTWNENYGGADKAFAKLVKAASILIRREIKINYDRFLAKNFVEETYNNSADKRIIIFKKGYPWKEVLIEKPEPLYVVFPTINDDGFMIQAVNAKKDSQEVRQKFPESWRGKAGPDLVQATGVNLARFCHSAGFLCVTNDFESACLIAKKAAGNQT